MIGKKTVLNILFLTSSMQGGGAERIAALLSNAWVDQGHNVTIMPTFSGRGGCSYTLHPKVELDYLADHVNGARGKVRRLWALRRVIRQRKTDVVVAFLTDVNIAALLAAWKTGVPVVVSERTYPPLVRPKPRRAIAFLRRLTYRWASSVVVQTDHTLAWTTAECVGSNAVVIANPLVFPLSVAEPVILPQTLLPDGRRCIIAVGRFHALKRHDKLIDAFARLAPLHPDWDLVIIGDGVERSVLEKLVASAGLADRVFMPGFVGNPGDWYNRSSIYVMASTYEGFPNTLIEAMAHGLPAVAFDVKTGPSEIMQNGQIGILLPDDDHVRRLSEALDGLIRDEARRKEIGALAITVRDTYAMHRILLQWDEVLSTAVRRKPIK